MAIVESEIPDVAIRSSSGVQEVNRWRSAARKTALLTLEPQADSRP